MKKVFQIIEKIVYGIAALAIVLVVIMMVYGIITNTQQGWQKVIPYLYLAAFHSVLPKDSLVSKDGVEMDLQQLREALRTNK